MWQTVTLRLPVALALAVSLTCLGALLVCVVQYPLTSRVAHLPAVSGCMYAGVTHTSSCVVYGAASSLHASCVVYVGTSKQQRQTMRHAR
jgi:hypothetical protein